MSAHGKLRTPYRQRILWYCEKNGIVVPKAFDAPQSSERYALIDVSVEPNLLHKRTSFQTREIIRFIEHPENAGRTFKILDFKRGVELQYLGTPKLCKVAYFDCTAPGELLSLIAP